ncbi:MAG: PilZ domain-containing protein [Deltaproteobacteria bacterium]|nr:PilZ domain-containing protein [Deltaproteobacteria bacterium]
MTPPFFKTGPERRRFRRIRVDIPANIRLVDQENKTPASQFIPVSVANVSTGGVYVRSKQIFIDRVNLATAALMSDNLLIEVSMTSPDGEVVITESTICWYNTSWDEDRQTIIYEMGLKFMEPDSRLKGGIKRLINAVT